MFGPGHIHDLVVASEIHNELPFAFLGGMGPRSAICLFIEKYSRNTMGRVNRQEKIESKVESRTPSR